MRRPFALLVTVIALLATGIIPGAQAAASAIHCVDSGRGMTLAVSCASTHGTIQGAVDAASPGDAVLIGPGLYQEAVVVTTPDLIIRGADRNKVVLKGDMSSQEYGIIVQGADRVEVSNLTAFGYTNTGVYWLGVEGYEGRYLTAYNNRRYGMYALGSQGTPEEPAVFEDSYTSGNADSGFYIGECNPCHARIRRVEAVGNALGYSGTNASNDLVISDSLWVDNGAGILPNTLDSEKFPPQSSIVIRDNIVTGSGNAEAPAEGIAGAALGIGIGASGGSFNVIENNTVRNCTGLEGFACENRYGIALFPFPEPTPNLYVPHGNVVRNNSVTGSGLFDLSLAAPAGEMNCFSGNEHATSDPNPIEQLYPCTIEGSTLRNSPLAGSPISTAELASGLARFGETRGDWKTYPAPPAQPTMPDPLAGITS